MPLFLGLGAIIADAIWLLFAIRAIHGAVHITISLLFSFSIRFIFAPRQGEHMGLCLQDAFQGGKVETFYDDRPVLGDSVHAILTI